MVKKRVQKVKKRRAKAAKAGGSERDADAEGDAAAGPEPPAHVKRKLARQTQFMQKIVASQPSSLSARSNLKKKRKKLRKPLSPALGDLSALSASLAAAAAVDTAAAKDGKQRGLGVGGCRQRARITPKETDRLQQVLAHPQFRADPIQAVTAHLAATMPAAPPSPAPRPHSKGAGTGKQKKKRKGKRGAARDMDTA